MSTISISSNCNMWKFMAIVAWYYLTSHVLHLMLSLYLSSTPQKIDGYQIVCKCFAALRVHKYLMNMCIHCLCICIMAVFSLSLSIEFCERFHRGHIFFLKAFGCQRPTIGIPCKYSRIHSGPYDRLISFDNLLLHIRWFFLVTLLFLNRRSLIHSVSWCWLLLNNGLLQQAVHTCGISNRDYCKTQTDEKWARIDLDTRR